MKGGRWRLNERRGITAVGREREEWFESRAGLQVAVGGADTSAQGNEIQRHDQSSHPPATSHFRFPPA